ncbi:MAG: CDP-diacylglycerol--glycerol-3-phosphate 3-phosphatidyltransferase [Calditrichaeota bacterium]|nr:CDP-diacylglycerol--glycerol-3-phosphate 3-phosphatidyltransferase [Calditrichota bacterium]
MNLPTRLTVLRIILTPVFVYLLFHDGLYYKLASFFVYVIASLTDWYDGYIAKKYGYVTIWGKFLDPLADKILVSAAFISFTVLDYVKLWVVVTIVLRDFLITILRSYAMFRKHPVNTIYLARVKTFFQMGAVYVVFAFLLVEEFAKEKGMTIAAIEYLKKVEFIDKLMIIVVILTVYTGVKYFFYNKTHLSSLLKAFYRLFVPSDSQS